MHCIESLFMIPIVLVNSAKLSESCQWQWCHLIWRNNRNFLADSSFFAPNQMGESISYDWPLVQYLHMRLMTSLSGIGVQQILEDVSSLRRIQQFLYKEWSRGHSEQVQAHGLRRCTPERHHFVLHTALSDKEGAVGLFRSSHQF